MSQEIANPAGSLVVDLSKIVMQIDGVTITPIEVGPDNAGGQNLRITMIIPLAAVKTGPPVLFP
jgi:hypothetical protein